MLRRFVLCFSLASALPLWVEAAQGPDSRALLDDCRSCLLKKGKDWDDRTWSNVYEWDRCLDEVLFRKLSPDQRDSVKSYLSGLGYYGYDAKRHAFTNAKKRIAAGDVDGILAVVERTMGAGERVAPIAPIAPVARPSVPSVQAPEGEKPVQALPEKAVVAAPAPRPILKPLEGERIARTLPEDRIVLDSGVVLLPKGVFLLVRKENRYGAIRFTAFSPADKAGLRSVFYESYFQGDGSGSFAAITVKKRSGRVVSRTERPGLGQGSPMLRMGEWSFGYVDPGGLGMFPYAAAPGDHGYAFAPVVVEDIAELDVHDKRIQWFRCDPAQRAEILLKDIPH